MRVTALHVYPVKSCRGIAVERASVELRGLQHDRRWMIVDGEGVFVTQREAPRLALVDVRLEGDELVLGADGHGPLRVAGASALGARGARRLGVRVWKSELEALDCGDAAARWIGEWVGFGARLVAMPDDARRAIAPEHSREGDLVSFADGFPLLLTTTGSLDDLNGRLPHPVPMDRFRPNVVVTGTPAWQEDSWTQVRLGSIPFRAPKPCGRCTVITVDQRTSERGVEPLRTLATFRQRDNSVLFGQNLIPDAVGQLSVGDELRVVA